MKSSIRFRELCKRRPFHNRKLKLRAEIRRRQAARHGGRQSVQTKMKKLQDMIPGGRGLGPDRLLLRTADYILHLRSQVDVLKALSKIYK